MADVLSKVEDLARGWSGFDELNRNLAEANAAIRRIAAINTDAAGSDPYGESYLQASGSQIEYVQQLTTGAEARVGGTVVAGSTAVHMLDAQEADNVHHANFGSHK